LQNEALSKKLEETEAELQQLKNGRNSIFTYSGCISIPVGFTDLSTVHRLLGTIFYNWDPLLCVVIGV